MSLLFLSSVAVRLVSEKNPGEYDVVSCSSDSFRRCPVGSSFVLESVIIAIVQSSLKKDE